MPLPYPLAILTALLLAGPAAAAPPSPPSWQQEAALPNLADLDQPAPPALLGRALAGHWRGALRYRDYKSDKAVTLPTEVVIDATGGALQLAFTYDDGPGKTVRSSEQWTFDGVTLATGKTNAPLQVSTYRANANGDLVVVALGDGVENGAPVALRLVVLRRGDALSISRASRLPQQDWLLRHVYRFTPVR